MKNVSVNQPSTEVSLYLLNDPAVKSLTVSVNRLSDEGYQSWESVPPPAWQPGPHPSAAAPWWRRTAPAAGPPTSWRPPTAPSATPHASGLCDSWNQSARTVRKHRHSLPLRVLLLSPFLSLCFSFLSVPPSLYIFLSLSLSFFTLSCSLHCFDFIHRLLPMHVM